MAVHPFFVFLFLTGTFLQLEGRIVRRERIIFPTSSDLNWTEFHPGDVTCLKDTIRSDALDGEKLVGYTPLLKGEFQISGFICEKVTLSVDCDTGLFGSNSIVRAELSSAPSISECSQKIQDYKMGTLERVTNPDPSCSWLQRIVVQKEFILIREESVQYDPYTGNFLSEKFPNTTCNNKMCLTFRLNKVWIPDSHHVPGCLNNNLQSVLFYSKSQDMKNSIFWSPDFEIPEQHEACIKRFCGKLGIHFGPGSWIGFDDQTWSSSEELKQVIKKWGTCDSSIRIKIHDLSYQSNRASYSSIALLMEEKCEELKEKMALSLPFSIIDLQAFNPLSPGKKAVYKWSNQTILRSISQYQVVNILLDDQNRLLNITDSMGNDVLWYEWKGKNSDNSVLYGPNGIFLYNNSLYYSFSTLDEYERTYKLLSDGLKMINSPHILSGLDSRRFNNSLIKVSSEDSSGSGLKEEFQRLSTLVSHWFNSTILSILYYLFITFFIYGSYKLYLRSRSNQSIRPMTSYSEKNRKKAKDGSLEHAIFDL